MARETHMVSYPGLVQEEYVGQPGVPVEKPVPEPVVSVKPERIPPVVKVASPEIKKPTLVPYTEPPVVKKKSVNRPRRAVHKERPKRIVHKVKKPAAKRKRIIP